MMHSTEILIRLNAFAYVVVNLWVNGDTPEQLIDVLTLELKVRKTGCKAFAW